MGPSGMMSNARKVAITLGLMAALSLLPMAPAEASGCDEDAEGVGDFVAVSVQCGQPGSESEPSQGTAPVSGSDPDPYLEYQWVSTCTGGPDSTVPDVVLDCAAARVCPDPAERMWRLWGREAGGGWTPLGTQCFGRPPTPADVPAPPTVGPDEVLTALRRIGLPALEARTQPEDKTLVNFATIFYAEPEPFTRTIGLLGQPVDVEATPATYTWHHGDGTSARTTEPGAPYPATDVTHSYQDAHTTVSPRVDVTYTARFRVNGGAWQDIDETVTITGPEGTLRIAEATAVLSGDYD